MPVLGPGFTLQRYLVDLCQCDLIVDGVVGDKTRRAWHSLLDVEKTNLDSLLEQEHGMKARSVVGERGFGAPNFVYLKKTDCDEIIARACKLMGMPEFTEVFKEFVRLEAIPVRIGGELCYNVFSRNGQHRGLMQFSQAAWTDARRVALSKSKTLDIGAYRDWVYYPANNIIAGIAYSIVSIRSLIKNGVEVNGETLYLSHNQGPYIWEDASKLKIKGQSAEAKLLIEKYFGITA